MSTAGPELTNYLNLKFSWKKVSKVRNTARRPASNILKLSQADIRSSPEEVEVPEVPEFEKLQGAAFQRQISSSMEHVPIKKRRFLLRSPSPPPRSPHPQESGEEVDEGQSHSAQQISLDSAMERENMELDYFNAAGAILSVSGNLLKPTVEVSGHNDDFSGIAMLADTVCCGLENSADDPGKSVSVDVIVKEQDGSASVEERNCHESAQLSASVAEIAVSSQLSDTFVKVKCESAVLECKDEATESFFTSDSMANVHHNMEDSVGLLSNDSGELNDAGKTAEGAGGSSDDSHNDRMHWDLNVPMDEWEEPLEGGAVASGLNIGESRIINCLQTHSLDNVQFSELHDAPGQVENTAGLTLLPSLVQLSKDKIPSNLAVSSLVSDTNENGHAPETSILLDSKSHAQIGAKIEDITHNLHLQLADSETQGFADNQKKEAARSLGEPFNCSSISSVNVAQSIKVKDEPCDFTNRPEGPFPLVDAKSEVAFLQESELGEACDEPNTALNKVDVDHGKRYICYSENELGKVSYQTVEPDAIGDQITVPRLETVSHSVYKSEHTGLILPAGSEPPAEYGAVKEVIESIYVINSSKTSMPEDYTADEAFQHTSKFHSDNLNDNLDFTVSHENRGKGGDTIYVGGYDSHLEDGELREPIELLWEENEGEEADYVDYDSDNRDGYDTYDAANDPVPSNGRVSRGIDNEEGGLSDRCNDNDDQPTSEKSTGANDCHSFSVRLPALDALESEQLKYEVVETGTEAARNDIVGSDGIGNGEIVASEIAADPSVEMVGTIPKRELLSQIEVSASSHKKDADSIRRSRNFASMYDGNERQTGLDESMGRGRSSLHLNHRDRLNHRSWNYVVKSGVANFAAGDGKRTFRSPDEAPPPFRKSTIISSSRSGYSHLVRKGSTPERDNTYGLGNVKLRDVSTDNATRGRFDRYIGVNGRVYKDGYRRAGVYEDADSADAVHNHFGRRERSFSPPCNRSGHLSQGHRRSHSRSGSRSPDFRPEARTGKMRMSFQPNNHAVDHVRGRRSPPARMFYQGQRFDAMGSPGRLRADDCLGPIERPVRYSDITSSRRMYEYDEGEKFRRKPHIPQSHRRSRSRSRSRSPEFKSEGRIGGTVRVPYQPRATNHIRDRRSPGRMFHPGQRTDDYVKPIMRPVRISNGPQSGRGNEYESDEFRRKPGKVFERIHPMRHHGMAGEVRPWFQYDAEDNDMQQNFRSSDRRSGDLLRSSREERGSTRYTSDRIYYSGTRSAGVRDFGDDAQPRAVRP